MTDAQRAGDVDHGGLGRPEAAKDILRRIENPFFRERGIDQLAAFRSLSRIAI